MKFGKRKVNKTSNYTTQGTAPSNVPMGFMEEVHKDTEKLSEATGITSEQAVQMASDFYRKYPMLVEHVRSIEYMTRNK
jgi:hypothetical protein